MDYFLGFAENPTVHSPVRALKNIEIEVAHKSTGGEDVASPLTVGELQPEKWFTDDLFQDKHDLPTGMCMHHHV